MRIPFNNDWTYFSENGDSFDIDLPHDAMLLSKRFPSSKGGGSNAFFDGGVYEYRKTFLATKRMLAGDVYLEFGGVYRNASIFLNGEKVGFHAYGYTPFLVELTGMVQEGRNEIRVIADNSKVPNSRWYTGGGIYRDVYLLVKPKGGIVPNSLSVVTLFIDPPTVGFSCCFNEGEIRYEVYEGENLIGVAKEEELIIPGARLWDDETPCLYRLKAILSIDGLEVDCEETTFGIRDISIAHEGLFVNGKRRFLRGGCIHHDNGILGAAAYKEAEWRKIRLLKEAGFNAIRSAHNPCSSHLLDACDYYGLYVIDEAYDMWFESKKEFDYAIDFLDNYESDIRAMVEKDRNHPSVLLYSLGNELHEPSLEKGIALARKMVSFLHQMDSARKVTAGVNLLILSGDKTGDEVWGANTRKLDSSSYNELVSSLGKMMNRIGDREDIDRLTSPFVEALDVVGYNYASEKYEFDAKHHPNRVIFGSETFCADIYSNWKKVLSIPSVIGDFMWTAIDYLGEVGLGGWNYDEDGKTFEKPFPWISADAGALDLIGTANAEMALAKTVWGLSKAPIITSSPANKDRSKLNKAAWRWSDNRECWSYNGCDGNSVEVEVFSKESSIGLVLNGKPIGKKPTKNGFARFDCHYENGTLTANAYNEKDELISSSSLSSAKEELCILLQCEKDRGKVGDLFFIDVSLADDERIVEANRDQRLEAFAQKGRILAFGSAATKTTESFLTPFTTTYFGRALLVVQAESSGVMAISVKGSGMESSIEFRIE